MDSDIKEIDPHRINESDNNKLDKLPKKEIKRDEGNNEIKIKAKRRVCYEKSLRNDSLEIPSYISKRTYGNDPFGLEEEKKRNDKIVKLK